MKKCLRLIILLSFIFYGSTVIAKDFEVGGIAYNIISLSDLTCEVTRNNYYHSPSYITAHETYKGKTFKVLGIGNSAFKDSHVSEITIENGITYIGNEAFSGCYFSSIVIPNSVTRVGERAFYYCGKSVKLWNDNYISVLSELKIEDGTEMIEGKFWLGSYSSFSDTRIKKLYIGRNINDALLKDALYTSLEELTIGDMVTELKTSSLIPSDIFDLLEIRKLTIGAGLKKVPYFAEGDQLNKIYVRAETPQVSEGFNDGTYMRATLYVPKGTKAAYETADMWKNFWSIEEYDAEITGIENVAIKPKAVKTFNINGIITNPIYRGIIIKGGKKYIYK